MRIPFLSGLASAATSLRLIGSCLGIALVATGAACVTPDNGNAHADSAADNRQRDVSFHHDDCSPGGDSKTVDVNNDGRPDIVHVMKDGREACRIVDLNFDGAVDVYIYYDEKGQERRREADFDRDGRPDQISILKDGQLVENQRETNFDDKIDTWDYYQNGVLVRRERDSDGDAIIDQWWQFYDPARPKCAIVAVDHNADGKPDADQQVDLCNDGKVQTGVGAPPPGATATAAPTAAPSGSTTAPAASPSPSDSAPANAPNGTATAPANTPAPAPTP
ncbi:MAG: hypothetical protein U0441_28420 [Polyangiaceae bacterium]